MATFDGVDYFDMKHQVLFFYIIVIFFYIFNGYYKIVTSICNVLSVYKLLLKGKRLQDFRHLSISCINLDAVKAEYISFRVESFMCGTVCRTPLVSRVCDLLSILLTP